MDWLLYLMFMILGAGIVLITQLLFFNWYIEGAPKGDAPPPPPKDSQLPKELNDIGISADNGDCAAAVSLALQFLFQELKHAPAPLAWLNRKLHQEMVDLLTRTTSGKLFESLTVRRIIMGEAAPRVQWAGVENVEMSDGNRLKTVDLLVDICYSGGFTLAVDAGMLLGKTACLDIEVEQLSGRARVRFTRQPYTHWSLSFISAPKLDLRARPLKGKLAALLQAHARRALQRRHTFPNYTIRYKPFFPKIDPSQLDIPVEDSSIKIQGLLEVTLSEITRLFTDSWPVSKHQNRSVYCTLSLDSNPWISHREDEEYSTFTLDIVINKERTQQLGTVFKQVNNDNGKSSVVIETVVPLSAAYKADLRRGDILVAVDNKIINNINQVAKIIKSISRPCFTVRIERKTKKLLDKIKTAKREDTLSVGLEDDAIPKRGKSNSFSFRKMSEMLESARTVGQEGRALLRGTHSTANTQDIESKSSSGNSSITSTDLQETSKTSSKSEESPAKTSLTSKNSESVPIPFGFGLRKRRCSVENRSSSDSSNSSTPTASSPGTPAKRQQDEPTYAKINNENYDLGTLSLSDMQKDEDETCSTPKISIIRISDTSPEHRASILMMQSYSSGKTQLAEDMVFGEKMSFMLNRNHRYLNLNIWGSSDKAEDVLLAYLNIPLQTVLKECKKSKVGQLIRSFILLPPDVNLTVNKNHPLSTHSGFEPCLCYGDILLTFSWLSQDHHNIASGKLSKEPSQDSKFVQDLDGDCAEYEFIEAGEEDLKQRPANADKQSKDHDFLRTHFHRSTQCDFCGKKIWLKDAVQCRNCAMCCHKKCVTKCLSSGSKCQPLPPPPPQSTSPQGEVTSPCADVPSLNISQAPDLLHFADEDRQPLLTPTLSQESLSSSKADEGLLGRTTTFAGFLGGLRRVGSAHSLAPPGLPSPSARSLPPSPHHSPRRQSPDEEHSWSLISTLAESGQLKVEDLLQPLLMTKIPPDILLARARDRGPQLLASLPFDERSEKIGNLITEVRAALDDESMKLSNLQASKCVKQSKSMEESEERSQALTALLLHCCSALQSANRTSVTE